MSAGVTLRGHGDSLDLIPQELMLLVVGVNSPPKQHFPLFVPNLLRPLFQVIPALYPPL